MKVILEHDQCILLHGDSTQLGEVLPPNSVDAIVCDPPAGIKFMGKSWDSDKGGRDEWIAWLADLLKASVAALKPGGYALVWAIPRTSHWTATALENAGLEVRDIVMHLFGTGFPKSLNLEKELKERGHEDAAEKFQGYGTALKPAAEHWILARKPLEGTYAENVLKYGTGGLNIDACRIGTDSTRRTSNAGTNGDGWGMGTNAHVNGSEAGRWPANVTLDEEAAAMLDAQSGKAKPKAGRKGKRGGSNAAHMSRDRGDNAFQGTEGTWPADPGGGASRFFYVAKAPRKEKDAGLEHLKPRSGGEATDRQDGSAGLNNPRAGAGRTGGARNYHPTCKGVALMRWLIRLITPPGGTVLDPFAGSGSTGVAAIQEGVNFIGCELGGDNDEYLPILTGRIRHALGLPPETSEVEETEVTSPADTGDETEVK